MAGAKGRCRDCQAILFAFIRDQLAKIPPIRSSEQS
jgi:hypothetical protein